MGLHNILMEGVAGEGGGGNGGMGHKKKIKKKKKKNTFLLGHLKIGFRGAKGVFRGKVLTHKIPFLDEIECNINKNRGGGCQT